MYNEFKDTATYYDELYVKKEQYQREAIQVDTFVKRYKKSAGNTLLDIACGTGAHITYLQDQYRVSGLDLSEDMLNIARRKFPQIPFFRGNMVDF